MSTGTSSITTKFGRKKDVPLVWFMYLVFTRMSGELPQETEVFVVVLVLRILSRAIINSLVY